MASGHVQVSPDSTGQNIDATSIVSDETNNPTVLRQGIVVTDPNVYGAKAKVEQDATNNRFIVHDPVQQEELLQVLYLIARELSAIRLGISTLIGQPLWTNDDRLQTGQESAH